MPPFSGPQGPFAGIAAGPDGTLYVSADARRQRAGACAGPDGGTDDRDQRRPTTATCRWRAPCARRSSTGCIPVGSQLPTEHELCERFAVSRYTVREALRRLREDNLVSSRPRAGTLVVPRPASNSYAQDVMSINDLLAFATGRTVRHRVQQRW